VSGQLPVMLARVFGCPSRVGWCTREVREFAMTTSATRNAPAAWAPYALGFVGSDGRPWREPLTDCAGVPFEFAAAVRSFPSFRGQRNWPGLWWSATMCRHVGYESWLERDHAILLDFDAAVTGFAAQPFWLLFHGEDETPRTHARDFFARRTDGTAVVVDCRPDDRIRSRDAEAFAATERACELVGWQYRKVGAVEPVLVESVRWLAGYRQPRFAQASVVEALVRVFVDRRPLLDGAEAAGRSFVVLPVLFHLLWCGLLRTSLTVPFSEASTVWTSR
jgi:hypothetical protein